MLARVHEDEHLGDIRSVIENYAKGADTRDTDLLEQSFHDQFRVVAVTGEGIQTIDKETYLALITAEKIGGVARELDIEWITAKGETAKAEVRLTANGTTFHDDLAFVREDGTWRIVNNVTRVAVA